MKYMKLSFDNADLEQAFQLQIQKQQKKGFLLNHIVPIIIVAILLIEQIKKENGKMVIWFSLHEIAQISTICLACKWPILIKFIQHYYFILDIALGVSQVIILKFGFMQQENNDQFILYDIILQFFLTYHTRYNFIQGSLTFIIFISARFYVQTGYGFSISSLGYLISGLFFIINQYSQEKYRRKLFIKSQRNKQLEILIQQFIDDQVSILEKDSYNVKFKTIIFNNKIYESQDQFFDFLKEVKLPQQKDFLLNYLFKSQKEKETLIGKHQNDCYQITYQSFVLKKQQIFLKIKLFNDQICNLVNYKDLFKHIMRGLQFRQSKSYKGKEIIESLYMKSFYYQFTRHFQYYRLEIEIIDYLFLKYSFATHKIQWVAKCQIKSFYSDRKLLFLLIYFIKKIHENGIICVDKDEGNLIIELYQAGIIKQNQQAQITKILYHLGYYSVEEQQSFGYHIKITLIDKQCLEKYY